MYILLNFGILSNILNRKKVENKEWTKNEQRKLYYFANLSLPNRLNAIHKKCTSPGAQQPTAMVTYELRGDFNLMLLFFVQIRIFLNLLTMWKMSVIIVLVMKIIYG
jgi:hypothetical protein